MLYRLGLATGEWNIEQPGGLAERMMDYQLLRWEKFYELEPFGSTSEEILHAVGYFRITNAIRAFHAGFGKGDFKPTELTEFMPSVLNKKKENVKIKSDEFAIEQFQYEKDILKRCGKPVISHG